jgi:uncharacterized protein (DUF433 family)
MDEANTYITVDTRGVRRVAGTRISLDSVVIAFQDGQSAEEIQRNFPVLTLEQVYGAITYYLGHRSEVEEYLGQQRVVWDRARTENNRNPSAAVERLRRMRSDKAGHLR